MPDNLNRPSKSYFSPEASLSVPFRDILVTSVSVITGAVLGWALSVLGTTARESVMILILVAIISVPTAVVVIYLSFAGFAANRSTLYQTTAYLTALEERVNKLVSQQAKLLSREQAYDAMRHSVENARSQVVLLATVFFDWEAQRRTYATATQHSAAREALFKALFKAIEREDVEYIRIFQLPPERHNQFADVLNRDDLYREEVRLISLIQADHPERARLALTEECTNTSLVMIDRKHLFINIDLYDPVAKVFRSPYVIFIHDAEEGAFVEIGNLVTEITTRRYRATNLEDPPRSSTIPSLSGPTA